MSTPKALDVKVTWYVIDADLKIIADEVTGPARYPGILRDRAEKRAQEYAQKTGHSVVLAKPESYH